MASLDAHAYVAEGDEFTALPPALPTDDNWSLALPAVTERGSSRLYITGSIGDLRALMRQGGEALREAHREHLEGGGE